METKIYNIKDIDKITEALICGNIIAFPTDTVFGLGCVYDDENAINKIKNAKQRDAHKPLPMMCANLEMIRRVALVDDRASKIIKHFFPGALTVVLNKKDDVPSYVTNGFKTIAIRIPDVKFITDMIDKIGKPLLVTSANISNEPSLRKYSDVLKKMDGLIDGIVEKDADSDVSSTIIDLTSDEIRVLREGKISREDILSCLK